MNFGILNLEAFSAEKGSSIKLNTSQKIRRIVKENGESKKKLILFIDGD